MTVFDFLRLQFLFKTTKTFENFNSTQKIYKIKSGYNTLVKNSQNYPQLINSDVTEIRTVVQTALRVMSAVKTSKSRGDFFVCFFFQEKILKTFHALL